ncbi:hypothetical protein D9C73_004491 [Collichthys lucidus]|uniref:Uncharacterized protein n=1 Tax=Collichthys lucidus TaxID=240159 RepID=A0A4V6ANV3_COLLU|nr:hypothetical protein D9C73_004491 [Collichthys lucidus]
MACLSPPSRLLSPRFFPRCSPAALPWGPRGSVGAGRACGGSVEAGSLLGRDGDMEWASKHHTDPMTHGGEEGESKTGETNSTDVDATVLMESFTSEHHRDKDIRPGTELLLYEDTAGTTDDCDAQDAGHTGETENKVEDKKDPETVVPNISIVQEKEGETKGGQEEELQRKPRRCIKRRHPTTQHEEEESQEDGQNIQQ